MMTRKAAIKGVLNVASHALMELTAISLYLALGGVALPSIANPSSLAHVTRAAAGPALFAFLVASLVNNLVVTIAIATNSGKSIQQILHGNHNRTNVGIDFLAAPLVFVFAWVYTVFGAIAAATLWVPILGLRQLHRTNLELEQTNEELLELMVKSIEA